MRATAVTAGHRDHRGADVPPDLEPGARPQRAKYPLPRVGHDAIDAGTAASIVQARAAKAGFDPDALGGHSLKRRAPSIGMGRGVHPTGLKQLRRHKSHVVLDVYLELGDPFEAHPLYLVL